jgi:DNA-binding ferritin-like protein
MRASASTKQRNVKGYFCGSYGLYGKHNPNGCRCHRVRADLLHAIVYRYLDESQERIAALLRSQDEGTLEVFEAKESELEEKRQSLFSTVQRMSDAVAEVSERSGGNQLFLADYEKYHIERMANSRSGMKPATPLQSLYSFVYERQAPILQARLTELDAEHSTLVDRVLSLPTSAKAAVEKANRKIIELEAAMDECRLRLNNLTEQWDSLLSELSDRRKAIDAARDSVRNDANDRRKAELVRQVIDRIVCRFAYSDKPAANEPKSYLESCEITPHEGDSRICLPNGNGPGPG